MSHVFFASILNGFVTGSDALLASVRAGEVDLQLIAARRAAVAGARKLGA